MASGGTNPGSVNEVIYSIQKTYILTSVLRSGKAIVTCNHRIDIPTIEPLLTMPDGYTDTATIVPCIEFAADFLDELNFTFETNEGVTVLPVEIPPRESPYQHARYVLVLPRGTTGVKSCKIIQKVAGIEIQHNFTFGIMPPPYNYDNALLGRMLVAIELNNRKIGELGKQLNNLTKRVTALENKAGT